jgi:plastocyanin
MAQGIFYDGSNLILSASVVHMSGSLSIQGVSNVSQSLAEQTQRIFTLGADGTSNYTFTGPGLTGTENDPTIYLTRGETYRFVNNMGAHPFQLQTDPNGSTGTPYNDGVTNNGVSNGTLTIDVQFDAPSIIYYQCTAHSDMGGVIKIIDSPISIIDADSEEYNFTLGLNLLSASSGYSNIAVGYNILNNNEGDINVGIGEGTLQNNEGSDNVGIGEDALQDNIGDYNVGIGEDALHDNQGDANVGIGYDTLQNNIGDNNVGIGEDALRDNQGNNNVGIGEDALQDNIGDYNVGIGERALRSNIGDYNVGIGENTGYNSVSGSHNTLIGAFSYISSSDFISQSTAIGANSYTTLSNTIILGNVDDTSLKVGIGTTTPSKKLEIVGDIAITGFPSISASLASGGGGGGGSTDTGSLMVTGSVSSNTLTFTKGDGSTFDLTVAGGGGSTDTGSLLTTASVSSNTITFTKGDSSTFDITVDTGSGGGGGGSQNLQQVLDTGNTATQDIDLTGHIDADEYKLLGSTIITGSGTVIVIGQDAGGYSGSNIYHNTVVGSNAFQYGQNRENTVIGRLAGSNVDSTTTGLTTLGFSAAQFHTGSGTVIIGQYSGQYSATDRSLIMGTNAGKYVTGDDIIAMGYLAAANASDVGGSMIIGRNAGQYASGSENTFLGPNAGLYSTGSTNVFIGRAAGNNQGDENVALGYDALNNNTGDNNTAFGFRSLQNNTGDGNVSFNGAGQNNTGNYNLFFGGGDNNSGNYNVALGNDFYIPLHENSGDRNLTFGSRNLQYNSGDENIALGSANLQYNGSGNYNIALGYRAGRGSYTTPLFTGSANTFIGYFAGYGNAGSGSNLINATAIGANATVEQSYAIVLGQVNWYHTKIGIGTTTPSTRLHIVGNTTTNAQSSLLVEDSGGAELFKVRNDGVVSIDGITNVSQSIADAASSGGGGSTDLQTVLDAGNSATSDLSLNGVLILNSGSSISNTNGNIVIGYQALNNNPGVIDTLAIGFRAIYNLTSNYSYNTAIGQEAMNSVGGGQNVAVGYQAGYTTNGGSNARSVYIGTQAGRNTVSTAGEVAIGYAAGMANSNSYSTGVGYEVFRISNGQYSVAIGYQAGRSSTGQRSTFVGAGAGKDNTGQYSVGIGYTSLQNTSGLNNVAIGYAAGYEGGANTLTGNTNTFLGYNASYGANTTIENSTAVGANITLTDSNTVILGNSTSVGVGTTSPTSKLHIDGTAGEQLRIANSFTPSSTSDPTGDTGDIAWDDSYIYVRTSAGWKKAALSTF